MKIKIPVWILILCAWTAFDAAAQVNFTSSNLPIIIIDTHGTAIVDDPKISADMGIIDNGPGKTNNVTDPHNNFDGKIGIEFRGSSSQGFPKKPYGLEVQDVTGNGIDVSLLGMPKKDDWTLNATYDDKTLMRDALAYALGRRQGRYAPRTRYCELVLNGNYQGVYVLIEKIKRDKNRVNIAKMDPTATDLTGGYIVKVDKTTGSGNGAGWYSDAAPGVKGQKTFFQYDYPKAEDITPAQSSYIQNYLAQFETALASDQFKDPVKGYTQYVDLASLVDFFIMNEVTKNPDGYRLSTYLYKRKDADGGKLFLGPIWDFNEGFGNVDYCTKGNPEGFAMSFNQTCPDDGFQIPFWWPRLFQDPAFTTALAARWASLRSNQFKTENVTSYIDSAATVLNVGARPRNFQRWPVLGVYVWPNYYVGATYDDEIVWLKNWVASRFAWLDTNIPAVVTGIADNPFEFAMTAYPNPFVQEISIDYMLDKPATVSIELLDAMGRLIDQQQQTHEGAGTYHAYFKLHSQWSGLYFVKARMGGQVRWQKILRQ